MQRFLRPLKAYSPNTLATMLLPPPSSLPPLASMRFFFCAFKPILILYPFGLRVVIFLFMYPESRNTGDLPALRRSRPHREYRDLGQTKEGDEDALCYYP